MTSRTMAAMTTAMRNPGFSAREGRVWKSLSVAGNGLFADSGLSATESVFEGACVVCSIRLLIAFQIKPDTVFGVADGIGQFDFGEIMSIKTLDITFVSRGNRFLSLHDF